MTARPGSVAGARRLAVACCGLALVSVACASSPEVGVAPATAVAQVTTLPLPPGSDRTVERVVDGDTVVVDGGERVRLIGVDTPESKDPRREVECFGVEAAAYTSSLLPPGTDVRLVLDVEARDRYDRTLAYLYREDGVFVNADLLAQGYAQLLTVPPNVAHVEEFTELQRDARERIRGLWAGCPAP